MQHDNKPINMLELLDGMNFPTTRENAIIFANDNGASEEALNLLRAIPEKEYTSMQDINNNLGKMRDPQGIDNLFGSIKKDFSTDQQDDLEEQIM